jgi:penicillin-binding protein 1A
VPSDSSPGGSDRDVSQLVAAVRSRLRDLRDAVAPRLRAARDRIAPRARAAQDWVTPRIERAGDRVAAAAGAVWDRLEGPGRRAGSRAGAHYRERVRPRALSWLADLGATRVLSDPRHRAAVGLPLLVLVMALVVGLTALPGLASASLMVGTVDEEVLATPEIPEIDTPAQRSLLFAADGSEMGMLVGDENRVLVTLDEIPDVVQQAVIAAEDRNFYEHKGINPNAIARAAVTNAAAGDVTQGGSTITQQYVKNALLSPEQTLTRKAQEALYAIKIEQVMDKDEILQRYLNIAYLGNGAYGVAAAAERYFGMAIGDVDLPRAALLAGIIRAPERFDPLEYPERATDLQHQVLADMAEAGSITPDEADAAKVDDITELLDPSPPPPPRYPFVTEYIKKLLLDEPALGDDRAERIEALFSGGLRIHTTIVPSMQEQAVGAIADRIPDPANDPMAGLVSLEPGSGQIRAMAVGPDGFGECDPESDEPCTTTKVNPLVAGLGGSGRQVGSTFKPILQAAALDSGLDTSWHTSTDSGEEVDGCVDWVDGRKTTWTPENYSQTGGGTMDMPDALRLSNNVFHAKLIAEIGPEAAVEMAHRLGIDSDLPEACAIALGSADVFPLDMAEAFGTLANRGVRCDPYVVTKVTDAEGNVLLEREPTCERVLDEEVADTVVTMMREVVRRGTATRAQVSGWDLAGKTGTTNDYKDAWFVGFGAPLVTAAWVGFELPEPLYGTLGYDRIAGGTVPAEIWQAYMAQALENYEPTALPSVSLDRYVPPPPPKPDPPERDDDDDEDRGNGNGNGGGNGGDGDEDD